MFLILLQRHESNRQKGGTRPHRQSISSVDCRGFGGRCLLPWRWDPRRHRSIRCRVLLSERVMSRRDTKGHLRAWRLSHRSSVRAASPCLAPHCARWWGWRYSRRIESAGPESRTPGTGTLPAVIPHQHNSPALERAVPARTYPLPGRGRCCPRAGNEDHSAKET